MLVLRGGEDDDLGSRRGLPDPRERGQPVHLGHRQVEQDEVGLKLPGLGDRLLPASRLADDVEAVLGEQPGQGVPGQRVVVDDQDPLGHAFGGILPIDGAVQQNHRFERFLWGQVLLFGLLGATLALFLRFPSLGAPYSLPELKLVLATVFMIAGALVAILTATRFAVEGRRYDLFLCCGFLVTSLAWLLFTIVPAVSHTSGDRTELWAAISGRMIGWGLIAAAPFVGGRAKRRRASLGNSVVFCVATLVTVWGSRARSASRSRTSTRRATRPCRRRCTARSPRRRCSTSSPSSASATASGTRARISTAGSRSARC